MLRFFWRRVRIAHAMSIEVLTDSHSDAKNVRNMHVFQIHRYWNTHADTRAGYCVDILMISAERGGGIMGLCF